ncbi:hypothetical protein GQ42DRAFT_154785 [Ramicandelaber brevisporus]|nr:hypothetical protein GQ42DRAFT_154785 [Ramicandelaber brevisporus]
MTDKRELGISRRFERGIPAAPTIFSEVLWQIRRAHIEANDPEQPVHVTAEGILCRAIRNIERRLKIHHYAESKNIAERLRPKRRKEEYKLYREWKDTMGNWLHFDPGIQPPLRFTFNSSTYFPSSETH